MNTLQDRIRHLRGATPQAKFASQIGVTQSTLGRYERGESAPDVDFIQAVYEKLGVEQKWLVSGEGPMRVPGSASQPIDKAHWAEDERTKPGAVPTSDGADAYQVPLVADMPSAGNGNDILDEEPKCYYPFPASWLRKKGNPKDMLLMEVSGDSMEPEIKHGDMVMLDRGKTRPIGGRFFVVRLEGSLYVKRLEVLPRKLLLVSLNKSYTPIEVDMTRDVSESVQIVGQIIWLSREMH